MYLEAVKIAIIAHQGQYRKNKTTPYVIHPIRVANRVNGDFMKTVAVLHDVLEDTDQDLSMFPSKVLNILDILNKRGNYFSYINRIKKNRIATEVKIADILDNLSDTSYTISREQVSKYKKALKILYRSKN